MHATAPENGCFTHVSKPEFCARLSRHGKRRGPCTKHGNSRSNRQRMHIRGNHAVEVHAEIQAEAKAHNEIELGHFERFPRRDALAGARMLAWRKLSDKGSGINRRRSLTLFIGRSTLRICPVGQKSFVGRTACDACNHNRHACERNGGEHAIGRLPPERLNEGATNSRPHHAANTRKSRNQTNIEARILIEPTRDKRRGRQIN